MSMTPQEEREFSRCYRRFMRYGFDKREEFTKEWLELKIKEQAQKLLENNLNTYGALVLTCANCKGPFFVDETIIQQVKSGKMTRPTLCKDCINDISYGLRSKDPYRNRLYDSMSDSPLELVGSGARGWKKDLRKARILSSYEIPDKQKYDCKNEELVNYVQKRAEESLDPIVSQYNKANDADKRRMCSRIATYIWILEGESFDFENCVSIYLGLPPTPEDKFGYCTAEKTRRIVTPTRSSASSKPEAVPTISPTPASQYVNAGQAKSLTEYFKTKELVVIDKRPSGGCLWVIGSEDLIQKYTDEASKIFNISGVFCNGSKSTGHRRSWYTKSNK